MSDKEKQTTEVPEELRGRRRLSQSDTFCFSCHPGLPCFTDCCADVNIMLTPVDVLRLARQRGLSTRAFLDQHALMPITKDLHLPVVMLKMGDEPNKACPFVSSDGCTVYENRPWSCRMYPVAAAVPPARAGVEPQTEHFLLEDGFCKGHGSKGEWTVASWRADQKVDEQEDLERGFREIVSHPWFIGGRQLNPKQIELFFTACYDLDTFRRFVFDSTFMQRFEIEDELAGKMKNDDEALLKFAYRWLRFALFAEPTLRLRAEAEGAAS